MSDEEECKCPPEGLPAWMGTFADLMSLLMCFFVLLLSFSEMDAMKFKRLAGSMAQAFGVQTKLKVTEVPKGTSIIAQEFSPGRPEPTPINEIWQKTDMALENTLDFECAEEYEVEAGQQDLEAGVQKPVQQLELSAQQAMAQQLQSKLEELEAETKQDAEDIARAMVDQIARGEVEVETIGRRIVIRIKEKGSFVSGSADMAGDYRNVLEEVSYVLANKSGRISIQGHSDDIPISTARYRSNWDLSAARAGSVALELLRSGRLDSKRMMVSGLADTRPLVPNEDAESRAKNRRVEIVIQQGLDQQLQNDINLLKAESPDILRELQIDPGPEYNLSPDEVF